MTRGVKNNLDPNRVCINCGKQLNGRRQFRFCTRECGVCWHNEQKARSEKECVGCGEKFVGSSSEQKYCSKSCFASVNNRGIDRHAAHRKPPIACEICGNQTRNKRFCSYKCTVISRRKFTDVPDRKRARRARHREAWYRY